MQRLGFPPNASLEHKKLSVDLAEVIIKWELLRIREIKSDSNKTEEEGSDTKSEKRFPLTDDEADNRKKGGNGKCKQ